MQKIQVLSPVFCKQTTKAAQNSGRILYVAPQIFSRNSQNLPFKSQIRPEINEYTPGFYEEVFELPKFLNRTQQDQQRRSYFSALQESKRSAAGRLVNKNDHSSPSGMHLAFYRDQSGQVQTKFTNLTLGKNRFNNAGTKVLQKQVNGRGKKRIKLAARMLDYESRQRSKKGKTLCSFVTLTFGKFEPTDQEAKKILDTFLKRCRRIATEQKKWRFNNKGRFFYLWVMEVTKRGVPHFHLLTPHFFSKKFINEAWSECVNNFAADLGYEWQQLYPEIAAVKKNVENYMTKYISKDPGQEKRAMEGRIWAISGDTREIMQPVSETVVNFDSLSDCSRILNYAHQEYKEFYPGLKCWISRYNQTAFYRNFYPFYEILQDFLKITPGRIYKTPWEDPPPGRSAAFNPYLFERNLFNIFGDNDQTRELAKNVIQEYET